MERNQAKKAGQQLLQCDCYDTNKGFHTISERARNYFLHAVIRKTK